MKRVLVCKPLLEESEESVCQSIIASLSEQKCETEIYTLQEDGTIKSQAIFDVILAFNKCALIAVTGIASVKRTPIVYIFFDIQTNIAWNHPLVKVHISIGNSNLRIPSFILQNKDYLFLPPIFPVKKKEQESFTAKDKVHLLFCVPDDILLSLIPRINKIVHYKTKVMCEDYTFFRDVFNTHIDVIGKKDKAALSAYICQTDIFIGYGDGAAWAISNGKPTIVLGPKGYGGMVTPGNIKWQAEAGLTGRIGGDYEEPIPVHLIFKEIDSCVHTLLNTPDPTLLVRLSGLFYTFNKSNLDLITNRVVNSPPECKTGFEDTLFVLSPDFSISAISNNRYMVTDRRINKYIALLNEKEYDYIKQFSTPHSIHQMSGVIQSLSLTEIKVLLSDLLMENILKTMNG